MGLKLEQEATNNGKAKRRDHRWEGVKVAMLKELLNPWNSAGQESQKAQSQPQHRQRVRR